MNKNQTKIIYGCLMIIIIFIIHWLLVCGLIKLITMLIGCNFDWFIATAIWLMIFLYKIVTG